MNETQLFTSHILQNAKAFNQRTGQYMFNCLPENVAYFVRGTLWDPFHKDLTAFEISEWIDSHLIFDGSDIIGVFNGDQLLWSYDPATPRDY
jgi:hypothetical protein